jgi:hypothetical protein
MDTDKGKTDPPVHDIARRISEISERTSSSASLPYRSD